jgi:hypothetical protein
LTLLSSAGRANLTGDDLWFKQGSTVHKACRIRDCQTSQELLPGVLICCILLHLARLSFPGVSDLSLLKISFRLDAANPFEYTCSGMKVAVETYAFRWLIV